MNIKLEAARTQMVNQQVRAWDVLDPAVLGVLAQVPREDFVPARFRSLAFADTSVPLGHGQFMLTPQVEGRLLQALAIRATDRILEIGTGSGFLTACLAALGAEVVSLEINPDLAGQARRALSGQGVRNAEVLTTDAFGYVPPGNFDVIAVTGSLPAYDRRFQDWLSVGGRLFVVVGEAPTMEALLVQRIAPDEWTEIALFETEIPALLHAAAGERFKF
jgi:protein-L-isoaspartate(D-aspartate) O-methyltransferase